MDSSTLIAIVASLVGAVIAGIVTFIAYRNLTSVQVSGFRIQFEETARQLAAEAEDVKEVSDKSKQEPEKAFPEKDLRTLPAALANIDAIGRRIDRLERRYRVLDTRRFALLQTYHNQGLAQSRVSFWFSLVLATAGFGVIVIATQNSLTDFQSTTATALPFIAGAITEAVSALFFAQSNQARRLMQDFFNTLSEDQRREEALNLADSADDPTLRSAVKAAIAMQLIDSKVSPAILPGFESSSKQGMRADIDIDGARSDQQPSAS
jgi:hypothetical protein